MKRRMILDLEDFIWQELRSQQQKRNEHGLTNQTMEQVAIDTLLAGDTKKTDRK